MTLQQQITKLSGILFDLSDIYDMLTELGLTECASAINTAEDVLMTELKMIKKDLTNQ